MGSSFFWTSLKTSDLWSRRWRGSRSVSLPICSDAFMMDQMANRRMERSAATRKTMRTFLLSFLPRSVSTWSVQGEAQVQSKACEEAVHTRPNQGGQREGESVAGRTANFAEETFRSARTPSVPRLARWALPGRRQNRHLAINVSPQPCLAFQSTFADTTRLQHSALRGPLLQ
jgi:hypothetical protein